MPQCASPPLRGSFASVKETKRGNFNPVGKDDGTGIVSCRWLSGGDGPWAIKRGVAAGRSAQRGTSGATTGGGGRSAPDPEDVLPWTASSPDPYRIAIGGEFAVQRLHLNPKAVSLHVDDARPACGQYHPHAFDRRCPEGQQWTPWFAAGRRADGVP